MDGWVAWVLGEAYNRLMAIINTTLYQIHDSTLKATMASCPLICRGRCRNGSIVLLGGAGHFHEYSWGVSSASSLALSAPRGMFPIKPVSLVRVASAITQEERQVRWGSI